jgi:hypothetical protein
MALYQRLRKAFTNYKRQRNGTAETLSDGHFHIPDRFPRQAENIPSVLSVYEIGGMRCSKQWNDMMKAVE